VELGREYGILRPVHTTGEIGVGREESTADIRIERPLADHLNKTDLGLGRPPVGADVDQLARVVLAGGRGDGQAGPDERFRPVLREISRGHRLAAIEVEPKSNGRVADARPFGILLFAQIESLDITDDIRQDDGEAG